MVVPAVDATSAERRATATPGGWPRNTGSGLTPEAAIGLLGSAPVCADTQPRLETHNRLLRQRLQGVRLAHAHSS